MEMNNIPEMFQSKLRLMIVSGLIRQPMSFSALKQLTGATDGNLSVQIDKLSAAGYISVEKGFKGRMPCTTCRLTPSGLQAFNDYVEALKEYLSAGGR